MSIFKVRGQKLVVLFVTFLTLVVYLAFVGDLKSDKNRIIQAMADGNPDEFNMMLFAEDTSGSEVYVSWWLNDENNTYYLFLPSEIAGGWRYAYNLYDTIEIDSREVSWGDTFDLKAGLHAVSLEDGQVISLEVMYSQNIASLFIKTQNGDLKRLVEDKENIAKGSYKLFTSEGEVDCNGVIDEIHTRGNASFEFADKKPFSIRLHEKTSVLGMEESKKWILAANAFDDTLSRNTIVTEMAKALDMKFVPESEYVDLYIDGEYQGNYQIFEKVEVADGRVDIRDLEKEMKDINPNVNFEKFSSVEEETELFPSIKYLEIQNVPKDASNGYLLELDTGFRYSSEKCGFISSRQQPVVVKSPEGVNKEQILYLATRYQELEDALHTTEGYNEQTGLYYYDYLDINSFAQKYLLEEISKNLDASVSSFFMCIPEEDGKFYAGPIWDYDKTFGVKGIIDGIDLLDPKGFYVSEKVFYDDRELTFFNELCQKKEFEDTYKQLYFEELRDEALYISDTVLAENMNFIMNSAAMDIVRWNRYGDICEMADIQRILGAQRESVIDFIQNRIAFLDEAWEE